MSLRIALEAIGLRAALPVLLRTLPFDRVLSALTPGTLAPRPAQDPADAIERITDLLTRRFRPTRTACLKRALMRYALLRRRGRDARFVIGVRQGGPDGFEAHAWIEADGRPIMEQAALDYRPMFVWPRDRAA